METLSIQTQEREGRTYLVLKGEADVYTSPQLKVAMLDVLDVPTLVVDLGQIVYMDSTALGVLIGCLKRRNENGLGRLILLTGNPRVTRLFRRMGVDRIFPVVDDDTAITSEMVAWPKYIDPPVIASDELSSRMTHVENGRRGGEATARKYGKKFYSAIGRKGGQQVKRWIAKGLESERSANK